MQEEKSAKPQREEAPTTHSKRLSHKARGMLGYIKNVVVHHPKWCDGHIFGVPGGPREAERELIDAGYLTMHDYCVGATYYRVTDAYAQEVLKHAAR